MGARGRGRSLPIKRGGDGRWEREPAADSRLRAGAGTGTAGEIRVPAGRAERRRVGRDLGADGDWGEGAHPADGGGAASGGQRNTAAARGADAGVQPASSLDARK